MKFSLIICTYLRPKSLLNLLMSVQSQSCYPDEIIIVDASTDDETRKMLADHAFRNLQYFCVSMQDRGLTKQRNLGVKQVGKSIEIVFFLDDDTVLEDDYFEQIIVAYRQYPNALGIGGYISNESRWQESTEYYKSRNHEYYYDGWKRNESTRFRLRKLLGLDTNTRPGFMPSFSHGRGIGYLPPSGKIYEVEQLKGGVSSYRSTVFENIRFSDYFEGYGLYEDADFSLRVSKTGTLYVNTAALLQHHHAHSGRPDQYHYGRMVVRNGWYVWRVKHPAPDFISKLKWHYITLLLAFIRFSNTFTTTKRKAALTEFFGRMTGWFSLFLTKPKMP